MTSAVATEVGERWWWAVAGGGGWRRAVHLAHRQPRRVEELVCVLVQADGLALLRHPVEDVGTPAERTLVERLDSLELQLILVGDVALRVLVAAAAAPWALVTSARSTWPLVAFAVGIDESRE